MSAFERQIARRVFARELNDANHTFKEGKEETSPRFVLLPTGKRANRVFIVGTLTENEEIGEDSEYWRARVSDPTGVFLVYAGQYQPEAVEVLRNIEPPEYVAIVGKPSTFETEEGEVLTSIRPESISIVDEETREKWVTETAERTIERIKEKNTGKGEDVKKSIEIYGDNTEKYKEATVEALENI